MAGLWLAVANWSTIVVCAVLKLPQGAAVLAAKSARGLSLESLLLELAGFFICLRYMSYYNYSLPTYIEYPIIIFQGALWPRNHLRVLLLVKDFTLTLILPFASFNNGTIRLVVGWYMLTLQKWIIDLAMNLSTVISAASKFAQLQYLWQTQDSGQVSALTWSLASYTCAARIFTTLMTTSDITVLVRFIVMLTLNIWVTATILRYRKKSKKIV